MTFDMFLEIFAIHDVNTQTYESMAPMVASLMSVVCHRIDLDEEFVENP